MPKQLLRSLLPTVGTLSVLVSIRDIRSILKNELKEAVGKLRQPLLRPIFMIKNIITFYRNPYSHFNIGGNETMHEKASSLKKAFILCLCSTLIIGLLIVIIDMILESNFNISITKNLLNGREEFRTVNSPYMASLKMCLLGPFKEEFMFRLPLITKSKFLRFTIFVISLNYFFSNFFPFNVSLLQYNIVLLLILGIVLVVNSRIETDFFRFYKENNYLCWILISIFSLIHIGNFTPIHWSLIYVYPIYVFPQFVYGIVFSFLAIKYNSFFLPLLLHVAINLTPEIPRWLNVLFHEFI